MPTAMALDTPYSYSCKICGRLVEPDIFLLRTQLLGPMLRFHECYNCAFWRQLAANAPQNSVVINGELVTTEFSLTQPFLPLLRKRIYLLYRDGQTAEINSIFTYGKIPDAFLSCFKTEAAIVPRDIYIRAKNNQGHKCLMKGCYDRYHCFFYNADEVETAGPWNNIPKNYQVGWEQCPIFINKTELFK